ncbi:hypothetical protein HYFRA_00008697 [Hymenoscyphus fraxineus]|uniref:Uncharacterized protein n=1 Tax=Hymenoscyphus fraxineus TaxID=746836 RepID=A0A9N9KZV3_9HELO|nr:hypothetical protein HYFRA_00008697 [Hymenoscyphus fraxineus]
MSAAFHSSNPFRRKAPSIISAYPENPSLPSPAQIAYQEADPPPRSPIVQTIDHPQKITKKVRVQSPPPSSPSAPNSASTIGENSYAPSNIPQTRQVQQDGEDPFGSVTSDTSEDEAVGNTRKAPPNPFSRTLETMEQSARGGQGQVAPSVTNPGRASLDVDAFKRLLMTGSAGLDLQMPSPLNPAQAARLGDGGSGSTDTSSISRQSIFEAPPGAHPESSRTSHELSELDDDVQDLTSGNHSSAMGKKAPPPPSSKHGRLLRLELRDDPPLSNLSSPTTPSSTFFQPKLLPIRQPPLQTDLNKPLPPSPRPASHDSDPESIFDKESAGKTPEPPSTSVSIRRKTPPAPPITRRLSLLASDSKLGRSNSARLPSKVDEEERAMFESTEDGRPRSGSGRVPPPPPSRRPASLRASSHPLSLSPSPSTMSLPAPVPAPIPPPTRGPSTRKTSSGRPPSVRSLEPQPNSKRASVVPPPPPPRAGRIHAEAQTTGIPRIVSGENSRPSIESHESTLSYQAHIGPNEDKAGGHDIIADLTALQREIDALRTQSEKDKIT